MYTEIRIPSAFAKDNLIRDTTLHMWSVCSVTFTHINARARSKILYYIVCIPVTETSSSLSNHRMLMNLLIKR